MAKDRSQTRSQHPGPLDDAEQVRSAKTADGSSAPSKGSRAERVTALLSVYVARMSDKDRGDLSDMLSDEAARKLGVTRNPQDVYDDFVDALETFAPIIAAGRLPGFGPMRARFGVDCVHDVAASLDAHEALAVKVRVVSKQVARTMALTGPARRKALLAVNSLVAGLPEERDRVHESGPADRSADERIRALDRLVGNVHALQRHFSETLLADAGLSRPVLDALVGSAQAAADARTRHRKDRAAKRTLRGELAAPVGRMIFEMRQLLASANEARRSDATIPAFTLGAARHAAKPVVVAPVTPPAPVVT